MTYKELIEKQLKGKSKYTQLAWVKKMIKIFNKIEEPDYDDKSILVTLNDIKIKLS